MIDIVGARDMETLCRRHAASDPQHSWRWLGKAERWRDLAHKESASRFHAKYPGPMAMGPNSILGDGRAMCRASQYDRKKSPIE